MFPLLLLTYTKSTTFFFLDDLSSLPSSGDFSAILEDEGRGFDSIVATLEAGPPAVPLLSLKGAVGTTTAT